ncbi:MAG TPA: ROK family protein [Stellaceae bacterium]|jgi:predicted TIM-barrel fold metal-dependent hydrolase/predicted NBD/HSP70 family sugar kinase
MAERRTLAVDIGGTGIKLALLDDRGELIGERVRMPTPTPPVGPDEVTKLIETAAAQLPGFDRVSVGFPGAVRDGRIKTAPNLGTELWAGFDLQAKLAQSLGKPVRVMNDADVQGFGAIEGKGIEMVLTLGTGAGTSIFRDGEIIPHLELAHHPVAGGKTYDQYIGNAALLKKGKKTWNKRVEKIIGILRTVVNFDHLYLGGGNAKKLTFELPADVSTVPNTDGLTGGIKLWGPEPPSEPDCGRATHGNAKPAAAAPPVRRRNPPGSPDAHGRTLVAARPRTVVNFPIPRGACDCHVHVFGEARDYPFVAQRGYTPPPASADELLALQKTLRLSRVVIVQPSVYGTDNSCTLDGMRRLGKRARGVAVIDASTSAGTLAAMHEAGIRGVRVNLATSGENDPNVARRNLLAAAEQVAPLGWHVQVYTGLDVITALADDVMRLPVPIVFDHFGGAQASAGPGQPGWDVLLKLVESGKAYVKVSGHYRSSLAAPAYADMAPYARALIAANVDRIVWGTDWPHPAHAPSPDTAHEMSPSYDIDDGLALNQLGLWAPDAATRRKILVDNPARLYDY